MFMHVPVWVCTYNKLSLVQLSHCIAMQHRKKHVQSLLAPTGYSGTPLNGHSSKADTHDITDNSESPDCPPIHFDT